MDVDMESFDLRSLGLRLDDFEDYIKNVNNVTTDMQTDNNILACLDENILEKVEKTMISESDLIRHQIQSFNNFMEQGIDSLLREIGEVDVESPKRIVAKFSFHKPVLKTPEIFPKEAILRKLTYAASLEVDLHVKVLCDSHVVSFKGKLNESDQWLSETVSLGQIPVMVNSSYCNLPSLPRQIYILKGHCLFDSGGYFIIKGSEKVLISLEEPARNIPTVTSDAKGTHWKSLTNIRTRSCQLTISLKYNVTKGRRKNGAIKMPVITVQLPYVKPEINVVILFYALGITSDRDLMDIMCVNVDDVNMVDLIIPSFEDANSKLSQILMGAEMSSTSIRAAAFDIIKSKLKDSIQKEEESPLQAVERRLFPHLGSTISKAMNLGLAVHKLLSCHLGRHPSDDRDSLIRKRLTLAGDLFYSELQRNLLKVVKSLRSSLGKALMKNELLSLKNHIDSSLVTKGFERAFSTGNWALQIGRVALGGMVVPLERGNPMATLSHLRQTEIQVNQKAKLWDARKLHKSYVGRLCLVQSPDGEKCGLVKSLALCSHVSMGSPEKEVIDALDEFGVIMPEDIRSLSALKRFPKVMLNGKWMGVIHDLKDLTKFLKARRRSLDLNFEVEIMEDASLNVIQIFCDAGRILRPLINLQGSWHCMDKLGSRKLKIGDLLEAGIVEYIGPGEEANSLIAADIHEVRKDYLNKHFTHCEICPYLIFGVAAALIPFSNHNHSARVMYQSQKHCRQAIGHYTTSMLGRADRSSQSLLYPQRPLVYTRASLFLNKDEFANGQNAIVAICPFLGFNQEDSILMNGSSLERGLFNSMHYRSLNITIDPEMETLTKPAAADAKRGRKLYQAYDKIESDGLPYVGANLFPGEIIFGKTSTVQTNAMFQDRSVELKSSERGRVDRVVIASGVNEQNIATVILREKRAPMIGDKFSSQHGQKGVVGLIVPEYDLPFTHQGIVPDIMINPHAFPSRQTVGQLLETHLGKVASLQGQRRDGSAFSHVTIEQITKDLQEMHFQQWGSEMMIHGHTGEMMDAKIFIGPTYYQRLKKMAVDQFKFRRQGPVHPLTHQPVLDRKRHGGVKIGEMERDCLLGHGVSANLQERLFYLSDPYQMYVCQECGNMVTKGMKARVCRFCKTSKHIVHIHLPYACKLLYQELLSMGIMMRLKTELA